MAPEGEGRQGLLVTFPGKLGDLLYSLPVVRALGRRLGMPVEFMTSAYCAAALPLLQCQPYLSGVRLDTAYRLQVLGFGCQPWRMSEPPGYRRVLHLGFRPQRARRLAFRQHLIEYFFLSLEHHYGLALEPELDEPYLFLEPSPPAASQPYLLLHPWGQSLEQAAPAGFREALFDYWRRLAGLAALPVRLVLGPGEEAGPLARLGRVHRPADLLELARLMLGAVCFLGVESAPAAVANGLKVPRLVLDYFGNALPTGPGGAEFRLDEPVEDSCRRLEALCSPRHRP